MATHEHHEGCNCFHSTPVTQSLEEVEFQRGLWNAAISGDINKVESLLKRTDPNVKDQSGYTALHYASRSGKLSVCKLLVQKGADVNAQTRSGATPLHRAAFMGHTDLITFLVESGANPLAKDDDGKTPFHKASEQGQLDSFQLLINLYPKWAKNQSLTELQLETILDNKGQSPIDTANVLIKSKYKAVS